jgi:hypothetical protein
MKRVVVKKMNERTMILALAVMSGKIMTIEVSKLIDWGP